MKKARLQFSIRTMLGLTALASAGLAVAVKAPDLLPFLLNLVVIAAVVISITQLTILRISSHSPRLSARWLILLGVFCCGFPAAVFRLTANMDHLTPDEQGAFVILVACGLACFWQAKQKLAGTIATSYK